MISLSICQFCKFPFSSVGVTNYEETGNFSRVGWKPTRLSEPLKPEQITLRTLDQTCGHCGAKYHLECKVINRPTKGEFSRNLPSSDKERK